MVLSLARALRDAQEEARALAPRGEAWSEDDRSTWVRLLAGLSTWRARSDVRASELLEESDPRTASETLADWEEALGLPDECLPEPGSVSERRALVISRAVGIGGGSRRFFVQLAAAIGAPVTITEGDGEAFRAGAGRAGDDLGTELQNFVWTVHAPATLVREARAGQLRAGDPIRTFGSELLECVIRRAAPAHTFVRFAYAGTCHLEVLDHTGAAVRVDLVGQTLLVQDEAGNTVAVPLTEGELLVYDENGHPVRISIDCPD